MPRIKEIEIFHKQQKHKFVIWYTEKDGFHVKGGLDADMLARVRGILTGNAKYNYHPDKGKLLEDVRKQLQEFVELYWKAVEASQRVILLSASFSDRVMKNYEVVLSHKFNESDPDNYREDDTDFRNPVYNNPRFKSNSYGQGKELNVEFDWTVADMVKGAEISIVELKRNKKGEWVKCGSSYTLDKHNKAKYVIIDYTQEREDFFTGFEEQFKLMADKIAGFMAQSDEKIASLVDSKQVALLPNN